MQRTGLKKLKALDIYYKTKDDVTEKSAAGASVTFVGLLVILLLSYNEFMDYLTPKRIDTLTVNHESRGETLSINFKVLFLELPCEVINIDVTDRYGDEQVGDISSITKDSWKGDYSSMKEEASRSNRGIFGYGKSAPHNSKLWGNILGKRGERRPRNKECMPCFEGASPENQCCNSCYALKKAFIDKGISIESALHRPQCQQAETDGCIVSGYIRVAKVQGNFHIAVGESHLEQGKKHHHHWPEKDRALGFNTTHYISELSFGESIPGVVNPLDGFEFVETGVGSMQYFLQVVPTSFEKSNGRHINSNQYSVTYHHNVIDLNSDHVELPGVFFKYDISPIMIHMKYDQYSFAQFITRLCAIVGGVWVVIGLVYSAIHKFVSAVSKKVE